MSKEVPASNKEAQRKAEVRPARVWQPTDLRHPIAPESGFVASAWRTQREPVFGLTDFDTPTADLLPPVAAPQADEDPTTPPHPAASSDVETDKPLVDAEALAQAREEGRAEGVAQTRAAMHSEMEDKLRAALGDDRALVNALQAAIAELQQSPHTFFEPLKRLALHLAEQLVLAELQLDGAAIDRLVQRCLDELAEHDESLILVELNPGDLAMLQDLRARSGLMEGAALRLQASDQLLPGSVRASANNAQVEDLIGDRLSALARGLGVNESRWRANSAFTPERIASDRIATTAVEDARPRMAQPAAPSAATDSEPGYDTVSAIDEILREAENHV
jgi:flagellar biosynthesis/type III secretory pathway protein FliH